MRTCIFHSPAKLSANCQHSSFILEACVSKAIHGTVRKHWPASGGG